MLRTKYFTVHIFHSCFFYVNPWDSNLANCPVFPRYFRESISDSHGTGDDLRASGIDREYDRTTDTCQISDSSRGYRTRTSQDWSRTIKNFVTMHAASSLSLPPLSPSFLRRYGLACSTAVKRVGSRVWSTHGALRMYTCAHADGRGWRGCRGTDLLRGRPGSCPTLSRYTIIFLVVCALISPRERYRPPSFSSPPSALPFVSWSVLRPCISSFFYPSPRPSWTRRRRSSLPRRSLPRRFVCLLDVLYHVSLYA